MGELTGTAFQRCQPFFGDVELSQPCPRLIRPPEHAIDVGGVLAG
ncbi:Uncharacterised protein [Mycobacterium tuberculosis]|uniref:Uncharacterized protein n=1 Tax=Mycobacterium tuberculosis TaxID=1773 RepID=A0A916P7W3_MYCTX|nr:Uncharacterised protein [Mycobacterium tuberculosis]COZ21971.1 Uncharacterised protein [Mycobacterium tuberculosis]